MDSKNTNSHQKRVMINVPLSVYYLELVLWPVLLHCLQVFGVEGACFFQGWGFGPPALLGRNDGRCGKIDVICRICSLKVPEITYSYVNLDTSKFSLICVKWIRSGS